MKLYRPKQNWIFVSLAILFPYLFAIAGCAWLVKPPEVDPLARQMVDALKQNNGDLKQYKALSHVRLELERQVQSVASMAVAAALPDRMRVELLSTMGQPITCLVADGQTIHVRPYGKERIYRFSQSDTAMEHLIHIPIGVEQLQGVLIGRPELPEYAGLQLKEKTATKVKVALISRWRMVQALLEFDADDDSIRMLEVFDEEGQSLYRVKWLQWRHIDKYRVPSKLQVESNAGYRVTVSVRRFWPDVALSPQTFYLDASAQSR